MYTPPKKIAATSESPAFQTTVHTCKYNALCTTKGSRPIEFKQHCTAVGTIFQTKTINTSMKPYLPRKQNGRLCTLQSCVQWLIAFCPPASLFPPVQQQLFQTRTHGRVGYSLGGVGEFGVGKVIYIEPSISALQLPQCSCLHRRAQVL